MHNEKVNISIILPSYNESENLSELIEDIKNNFNKSKYSKSYEIIVVNDGSTDNTEKLLTPLINNQDNIILINLKSNVGKAYALDAGIKHAKGNVIATMDSDLQYKTDDLIKMIDNIYQGSDLVNGKRFIRKDNVFTKFFSIIYNFLLRALFRIHLRDFFSGIKVFKKEIYNLMDYSGLSRFIIFFSRKYNYKISEISVNHFKRLKGKTAYSLFDRIILALKDMFVLVTCIMFGKEGIYQVKQLILTIYFFIFMFLIFFKVFLNSFKYEYLYYTITSFLMLSILNLIIQSFLKSKEKNNLDLMKNIKSIKKKNI